MPAALALESDARSAPDIPPAQEGAATAAGGGEPRFSPALREAVQVTLVCGVAITAFVVFSGARSRGDTLRKAMQRVGGAATGVLVATFILPVPTRRAVRLAASSFLDALDEMAARLCPTDARRSRMTGAARALDRDFQTLAAACSPLLRLWAGADARYAREVPR